LSAAHHWRSELLGERIELDLPMGRLEAFRRGRGPHVVFAHGWLANANLWRRVIERLAGRFTCVALDLPLGAHRLALPDADLSPAGCGALIASALDALELNEVTLVGNDSGGAYSQIATSSDPERIGRLVLNSCETPYDRFPPPPFDGLPAVARDPNALGELLGALRDRAIRSTPAAFGLLVKHGLEDRVSDSYALPCSEDRAILADTARVMASASSEPVHAAGHALIEHFQRPVLLVWSPEDSVFPIAHARRYADALTDGRLTPIDDAYSFTPEDQPEALADVLADFAAV
jgi:pimeloyl-ACP methyl ester carboxylesterase